MWAAIKRVARQPWSDLATAYPGSRRLWSGERGGQTHCEDARDDLVARDILDTRPNFLSRGNRPSAAMAAGEACLTIEPQGTRTNTGFPTFGRIGGRPKDSEKERPGGRFWAGKRGEKGVSRPKVWAAERGENEAITRQNPPVGQAGLQRQRMFR